MKSLSIILAIVLFSFSSLFVEAKTVEKNVILTDSVKGKEKTSFDCGEKKIIYVVLPVNKGSHNLRAEWFGPGISAASEYALTAFDTSGWLFIKLQPARGGKLFGGIDSSFGMDKFIGQWKVDVYIDKELVATKNFLVAC